MRTNFENIKALEENYIPKRRGVVSASEILMIKYWLQIREMSVLELRNLRDFVVMFYSIQENIEDTEKMIDRIDKMSAITHVIDSELLNREVEI
jgi:hypothetical protein